MSAVPQRVSVMALVAEAVHGGARLAPACAVLGFSERTLQRWQLGAEVGTDARTLRHEAPSHKLSLLERAVVLAVANSAEYGHLPPSQIVPRLTDQQRYVASESTFYRILREENQLAHRRPERAAQKTQQTACRVRDPAKPAVFLGHYVFTHSDSRPVLLSLHLRGCVQPQNCRRPGLCRGK